MIEFVSSSQSQAAQVFLVMTLLLPDHRTIPVQAVGHRYRRGAIRIF